jgi:hypothetical protein
MPADPSGGRFHRSRLRQSLPVSPPKRTRYRDWTIVLHKAMPPREPRHSAEDIEGHAVAMQVVDKPAALCCAFHPADELDYLGITQMMREK